MASAMNVEVISLQQLILDQLDAIQSRLDAPEEERRRIPSCGQLRYWHQVAGTAHYWLMQGRSVEIAASLSQVNACVRGLMAICSHIPLQALWQPEMMTGAHFTSLHQGLETLRKGRLTYIKSSSSLTFKCLYWTREK
ncbi:MAG: hypothetical protein RLZZ298_2520 [Pseudomonadota bacterium]|jgi:hypothetical protein